MAYNVNGKGDTYRVVDPKKWESHYDSINWKSKKTPYINTSKKNNNNTVDVLYIPDIIKGDFNVK